MSDSIIRWWPKSGVTMSIASMDERHAALAARLAEVYKTLAPLVDDDNRPVEALARYAVARLAEAERLLRADTVGLPYWCEEVAAFLGTADSASNREDDSHE